MDLKKFESLSDPEKIKILKICEILSQKTQFDVEIESVPPKSVGKQKTLDGWLLKSKETSGHNSNSSPDKSKKKLTSTESVGSLNVSEHDLQDVVKCTDSKISESRDDKTLKHDFVKPAETYISDDVVKSSENKLSPAKNAELIKEIENNPPESGKHNTLINDILKKNPFVLIERLNLTNFPGNSIDTSTAYLTDRTLHLNEESSQHVILPKPSTDCNKTSLETSSNEGSSQAVKTSPLEIGNPGVSSCSDKRREAYHKLKNMCSNHGLNLDDIFQAQEFKEMIEKYKSLPGAILFIGSHKCDTTGKVKPIVNFHKSKKELKTLIVSKKKK